MLTNDERTFFTRVADYMVEAKMDLSTAGNIEAACKAVLERDEQLWLLSVSATEEGAAIRSALCAEVYHRCRR